MCLHRESIAGVTVRGNRKTQRAHSAKKFVTLCSDRVLDLNGVGGVSRVIARQT